MCENYGVCAREMISLVSVTLALITWVATVAMKIRSEKKKHTIDLISQFQSNDGIYKSDLSMALRIKNNEKPKSGNMDIKSEETLIRLLDYYEFIATSVREKYIIYDIVKHLRGGAIFSAFELSQSYIVERRLALDRPELYLNFEWLYHSLKKN
jgi:hypothetical protein